MRGAAFCAVLGFVAVSGGAAAQSVRVSGATTARYLELRPFLRDSVPASLTSGSDLLRQLADGRIVRCLPGEAFCRDVRAGSAVATIPVIHDVEMSAWGLGEGVRAFSQLRVRTPIGANQELWPRAEDAFDVLSLYGELMRERLRLRAGRQWKVSGLGFYNYDGASAELRPRSTISIEAYGGRSLVRGLNEARTAQALEAIEPLSAVDAGILFGVHARYRPSSRVAVSGQYQLDMRGDRRDLYAELAMADGVVRWGEGSVEAAIEVDVGARALNQARLHVRSRPVGAMAVFAEGRRYRPYFELWTIWGAFSPVGFDEGVAGATWAGAGGALILRGEATYRAYDDSGAEDAPDDFKRSGWGFAGHLAWVPRGPWSLDATYRVDAGFGAARQDAGASLQRQFGDGGTLAVQGTLFQRVYEFRLDEGTVAGLGVEVSRPIGLRLRAAGSATLYRHVERAAAAVDWGQRRASVRLEWALGDEPRTTPRAGVQP